MTTTTESGVAERRVGRYLLEDLVAERGGTSLWRATDPALHRPVGARLLSLDDPRVDALRAGALAAASVDDRRLVKVLDVVETPDHLAVITEWVAGRSWSELLKDRWSVQDSLLVSIEVGRALEAAHAAGVTHGRIRPDSVMITDTKEVRLRGLGVEAAIWGVDPEGDPHAADLHGLGALLYSGMTLRWPSASGAKSVDGLQTVRSAEGVVRPPSALVPQIPSLVDSICVRSLASTGSKNRRRPYSGVTECVRAMDSALEDVPSEDATNDVLSEAGDRTDRIVGRLSTFAIFLFALAGIGLLVWQLFVNLATGTENPAPTPVGAQSSVAPIPPFETPLPESSFTIASASEFDPGGDGVENPDLVAQAIDRSNKTAWVTEEYLRADMSPKTGVGLVLDMGTTRSFRALNLRLYGTGSDFQVLATKKKWQEFSDFREVVSITAAGDTIGVRTPKPVKARYVMVWFTGLPYDGSNYVGGLRDVKIVG